MKNVRVPSILLILKTFPNWKCNSISFPQKLSLRIMKFYHKKDQEIEVLKKFTRL